MQGTCFEPFCDSVWNVRNFEEIGKWEVKHRRIHFPPNRFNVFISRQIGHVTLADLWGWGRNHVMSEQQFDDRSNGFRDTSGQNLEFPIGSWWYYSYNISSCDLTKRSFYYEGKTNTGFLLIDLKLSHINSDSVVFCLGKDLCITSSVRTPVLAIIWHGSLPQLSETASRADVNWAEDREQYSSFMRSHTRLWKSQECYIYEWIY